MRSRRKRNASVREVIEKKNTGLQLEQTASELAQALNSMRILANEINIAVADKRNQNDINEAMKLLNDVAQELPTKVDIKRWDDKLLRAIQSRDAGLVDGIIREGIEFMELPVETNELLSQSFQLAMVGSEKMGSGRAEDLEQVELEEGRDGPGLDFLQVGLPEGESAVELG